MATPHRNRVCASAPSSSSGKCKVLVRVAGRSMAPRVMPGDFVLLERIRDTPTRARIPAGQLVRARVKAGKRTACVWGLWYPGPRGRARLARLNPEYPEVVVRPSDMLELQRMVEHRANV